MQHLLYSTLKVFEPRFDIKIFEAFAPRRRARRIVWNSISSFQIRLYSRVQFECPVADEVRASWVQSIDPVDFISAVRNTAQPETGLAANVRTETMADQLDFERRVLAFHFEQKFAKQSSGNYEN